MIFLVSSALFKFDSSRSVDLLTLMRIAARRYHSLFAVSGTKLSPLEDADDFINWRAALGERIAREVDLLVAQLRVIPSNVSARGSVKIAVQRVADEEGNFNADIRTDLDGAVRIAGLPLYVLLENGLSDAAFLRRTMPSAWAKRISEWESSGMIQFENGGGITEMVRIVEHYSTGAAPDPTGLGQLAWRASHVLISDRDSHPDGSESADCKRLMRSCGQSNMAHRLHVLRRRNQESYLPRLVLDKIVESKTDVADKQRMTQLLDEHFADAFGRLHKPLPRLGEDSWFKNVFVRSEDTWESSWFEQDGSKVEMTEIAELVASLI